MTYQDLRSILIKSTSGEHGIYVFRLFEFVYGEVNPTKELNEKHRMSSNIEFINNMKAELFEFSKGEQ
mgnify:CR=1 FL=1